MMKTKSVYLETSIISYLTALPTNNLIASAYQKISKKWWKESLFKYNPYISQAVIDEIRKGDEKAAQRRLSAVENIELADISMETYQLSTKYFEILDIPEKARLDTLHIACAVLNEIDYILSWNFKHIANVRTREKISTFNAIRGLKNPMICTPEELENG
jgi:hypothetical protein